MKPRFWISVVLILPGAGLARYQSGRFNGVENTRIATQQFLNEFARSTDPETY